MVKKMIELFIYYILSTEKDGTKELCIEGCYEATKRALNMIKNEKIQGWNSHLKSVFSSYKDGEHPGLRIQNKLIELSQDEYEKDIAKAQRLFEKYSNSMGTLNYDALYLVDSERDVSILAYLIVFRQMDLKEIKKFFDEEIAKNDNKDKMISLAYELAWRCSFGGPDEIDFETAFDGWKTLTETVNFHVAKYELAWCYLEGKGIEKDEQKAYNIFYEIMPKDIRAKYQVAKFNYLGTGIEKDYKKAFDIFNELKDKSPFDMEKCICGYLGEMYFYGLGVEQDRKKGFELLEKAWNSGYVKLKYEKIKKILKEYYGIND